MDNIETYAQQTGNGVDEFTESEYVKRERISEYHRLTGNGEGEYVNNDKYNLNHKLDGEIVTADIKETLENVEKTLSGKQGLDKEPENDDELFARKKQ